MKEKRQKNASYLDNMVFIGFGLAAIYWLLEAFLYAMLSDGAGFLHRLVGFDISGILPRMMVLCFFMIFGSHAQYIMSKREEAEDALLESEERYRTIIESAEDGYYEVDLIGNLIFFNDSLCRILGYPKNELSGMNIQQSLDDEDIKNVSETFKNVHKTEQTIKVAEWTLIRKDGSEIFVEPSISLIKEKANPIGFRGFLRDVTSRKKTESLKQEKLTAEAASRSKSQFLANMSHEIRTPLNSIIGLVELIMDTDLNPDQKEDLGVVKSAAYSLLSVINDILDFSKIEAGKLELEKIPFNLRDFLGESLKIVAGKAQEKRLELAFRVAPDVPDRIVGDPARFRQIVLNLVGNAIKFTEEGEIIVSVKREQYSEAEDNLHFSVRDTGIGIPKDKQDTIFSLFEQADGGTSRRYGGTGLGLAVSGQLVELMNGRIWVESEPGLGSTFQFFARFDVLPDEDDPLALLQDIELRGMRALVVDDNASTRQIIQEIIENWGMLSETASGTEEAQHIISQAEASGKIFHLVLVDSEMPGSNGHALCRWIKNRKAFDSNVVMMLSLASFREHSDLQDLNIKAGITKPIRPSDLLNAIITALGIKEPVAEVPLEAPELMPSASKRSLRILVAEDTPFNQKFILRLLGRWGHQAVIADNGRLALDALAKDNYDLVLMDVQMPEMDGFETTKTIRESEKQTGQHIPIIAMTAHAMKGDRERCLEAGMDDYISKPISSDTLLETIRAIVPTEDVKMTVSDKTEESLPSFDKEKLLDVFDHDWSFVKEAVDMLIADYPPMVDALRDALKTKDANTLRRNAHALKGMVGNFQAKAAAQAAFILEEMGRQGEFSGVEQAFDTLINELDKLESRLLDLVKEGAG